MDRKGVYSIWHVVDIINFYIMAIGYISWTGISKSRIYWISKLWMWPRKLRLQCGLKRKYVFLQFTVSTSGAFLNYNQWSVFHHNTYIHIIRTYTHYSTIPVQKESVASLLQNCLPLCSTELRAPAHNMEASSGSRSVAPLIPNLITRWRWVVNVKLRLFYLRARTPEPIE